MIRLIGARCTQSNLLSRGVLIVRFLLGNLEIILLSLLMEIHILLTRQVYLLRVTAFSFQVLFIYLKILVEFFVLVV